MLRRTINPSKSNSFFLFGARGTGKSTWVKSHYPDAHYIDLLEDRWESRYVKNPDLLQNDLSAIRSSARKWVIIDEVQKIPKLLDIVHKLIEGTPLKFILTGSSARKLKRGNANLLAGRAFLHHLFPLTFLEMGDAFELEQVLNWGALPRVHTLETNHERAEFLRAYTHTYLREEILQEQVVRSGTAFRMFLEVAAQESGKALNFAKIGRGVGVDGKTVQTFFQILEDTLFGFFLNPHHSSSRKAASQRPKFFLFDLGVKKALEGSLGQSVTPRTSAYGDAFEHFVICEAFRLNDYLRCDFTLSHYQHASGAEMDLLLRRGRKIIAVEVNSTERVDDVECAKVERIAKGLGAEETYYVSRDPVSSRRGGVECLHWQAFLRKVFVRSDG